ncbi:MAG TPA: VWA domain-containing protein [Burkholderiaceae bacterium]|nr:VWA domain-containing protein [Burkholderiaceae bacterium]
MMMRIAIDAPYERLESLPHPLWLPSLVASAGERAQRLTDTRRWLDALQGGHLPPVDADFGDAAASAPLRTVVGELGLAALARGVPALAEQLLRTLLWHLDRIVDLQPRLAREAAIDEVAAWFRTTWEEQASGLDEDLALLQGLGDLTSLRWDSLRGHLTSRSWAAARRASEWLRQLPELAALMRRLGRSERAVAVPPRAAPRRANTGAPPQALRAIETRLPDAPGEITGVRFSSRPERMLAGEAVMLHHPVLRKLWRARHAEARLLSWETEAVLTDWRLDPRAARPQPATPEAEALERGPIIVCLDTSGSMRGAPENIAKATVIAALRAAHEARRGCKLIAFGGPDEVIERDLGHGEAGLQALLDLMAQAFDGGTDIQTPIERAITCVHDARWASADLLIVSDGEFGCVPGTLERLQRARAELGLRVQGVLVGDRETMGLLEVCDEIHWVRDWRRYVESPGGEARGHSPVHSKSLTALYFPNALSAHAARHVQRPR